MYLEYTSQIKTTTKIERGGAIYGHGTTALRHTWYNVHGVTNRAAGASLTDNRETSQDTTRCCYHRRPTGRPLTTATKYVHNATKIHAVNFQRFCAFKEADPPVFQLPAPPSARCASHKICCDTAGTACKKQGTAYCTHP